MKHHLTELLSSQLATTYGTFYSTVYSALLTRSRATLPDLIRALPKLSPSDIRLALATLVSQHIVNHHTDEQGVTSYEPHWENGYNFLVRLPTLRKFVSERFDGWVGECFMGVAAEGAVSVGALTRILCGEPEEEEAQTNGATNGEVQPPKPKAKKEQEIKIDREKVKEMYAALNLLLTAGYLMRVTGRQFWPAYDRDTEAIDEVMATHFPNGVGVKKERDLLRAESDKLLRKWREEDENYVPPNLATANGNARKRGRSPEDPDVHEGSRKRRQLQDHLPVAVEQTSSWLSRHQTPLDDDLILTVNFDKCSVGLRTQIFTRHAERHINPTTAKVYNAVLRYLEGPIPRCRDPLREKHTEREFFKEDGQKPFAADIGLSQPVSIRDVADLLPRDIDLSALAPEKSADDIADSIEHNGTNGHAHSYENSNGDSNAEAVHFQNIQAHLNILVSDPQSFLVLKHGQYHVPFHQLTQRILEMEIETMVTHTHGTLPARMLRILKFYGNQELKQLAGRAMVTEDEARQAMTLLQREGWVDVVELPRTARREVSKSMWLWSYDVLRAREKCLGEAYFTMSRLSMRLQHERAKIERTIDKSERSDVVGQEDRFLSRDERGVLLKYNRQTEAVVRQMTRMDEVVAIMRDFSEMEYPHNLWDFGWIDWRSPTREDGEEKKDDEAEEDDDGADED